MKRLEPKLDPTLLGEGRCRFCAWAPFTDSVEVHHLSPQRRLEPLVRDGTATTAACWMVSNRMPTAARSDRTRPHSSSHRAFTVHRRSWARS